MLQACSDAKKASEITAAYVPSSAYSSMSCKSVSLFVNNWLSSDFDVHTVWEQLDHGLQGVCPTISSSLKVNVKILFLNTQWYEIKDQT